MRMLLKMNYNQGLVLLALVFGLSCTGTFSLAQMATNPLIWADVPDVAILRVGDTYYMSSTTMHMNPGVPIMKSKDLVNWDLVNYCYATLSTSDSYNLNNGKQEYGHGSWASSIRYKNGTYYVATFANTGRTYIYKTTNIETGPWTVSTLNASYHDCSLFFDDDDRVYLIYGGGDIKIIELTADASAVKGGGVNKTLISNAGAVAGPIGLNAEGSQVLKVNGYYYINNICWPSGGMRTQILHRSTSITGTYESRVILKDQGVAQGSFINTPEGKWYAYLFKDNGAVGRIPYLVPMTWSNGWPVLGVNDKVPATLDIPKGRGGFGNLVASDEFSQAPPLKLAWQWNHNPQNNYWSLTQKSGYLRLTNERTDPNVLMTTNTLTQRTFGPKSTAYTSIDVSGMKDGDYAGILALQKQYGYVGVKMSGNTKSIIMVTGDDVTGIPSENASIPLSQNTVYVRIDMDFTNRDKAYFYYSLNGTNWTAIGSTLQMAYTIPHFMGYRFGLFTYATKSTGGYADFDFYRVGANITEAQNAGPTVAFTSPSLGASFTSGTPINLEVSASSPNGISNVRFYDGATLLSTDNAAPYNFTLTNAIAGSHTLKAIATDNQGKTAEAVVTIKVNVPQGPYKGTAHVVPGTIQLEEYDLGGNGVAYSDDSPGSSVTPVVNFRTDEDVDIETCTDTGGGYNLGYTTAGEWLEYTVNVTSTGLYKLDFRAACDGDGRTVTVAMGSTTIAENIAMPNTGGWQNWQTVTVNNISLTAGTYVMRLTIGSQNYINLNYLTFTAVETNKAPLVSLVAPAGSTTLQTVTLTATASDPDGSITSVKFYDGTTLLNTDNSAPYSYAWSGMTSGVHTLTAVATDDKGLSTTSANVTVTIEGVQSAYNQTAHLIPGRIEAEEYDLGGEGLAYHEANTNGNEGAATLRNDEVDIEVTKDSEGSYNASYILQGEWLEYSVNIAGTGTYDLDVRVAADGDGKAFHIEMDGKDVTGPISVPNTTGWQTWKTVTLNEISLTAGEHIMRIAFDASYMNLNYVEFRDVITGVKGNSVSDVLVIPNPFNGAGLKIQKAGNFNYRITDLSGDMVESGEGSDGKVIGLDLNSGMYFLIIENNQGMLIHKIVRQ